MTGVRIKRTQIGNRTFDQIGVVIADLHLHADLTCDREIRLAKRLADAFGVLMWWDADNSERCCRVLGVKATEAQS